MHVELIFLNLEYDASLRTCPDVLFFSLHPDPVKADPPQHWNAVGKNLAMPN
jgi:hypothetical protein